MAMEFFFFFWVFLGLCMRATDQQSICPQRILHFPPAYKAAVIAPHLGGRYVYCAPGKCCDNQG